MRDDGMKEVVGHGHESFSPEEFLGSLFGTYFGTNILESLFPTILPDNIHLSKTTKWQGSILVLEVMWWRLIVIMWLFAMLKREVPAFAGNAAWMSSSQSWEKVMIWQHDTTFMSTSTEDDVLTVPIYSNQSNPTPICQHQALRACVTIGLLYRNACILRQFGCLETIWKFDISNALDDAMCSLWTQHDNECTPFRWVYTLMTTR